MNILFLSLNNYQTIKDHNIYTDLLREFIKNGDIVYSLTSVQQYECNCRIISEANSTIIPVYTGRIQKTNIIEKGINTILIAHRFKRVLKKYLDNVKFDLILYPTPPITLASVVSYVKKRDNARTYLLLKDIFPQNAVDMGMMSKLGIKAPIYWYFRYQEKKLYGISDHIGCMSPANVDYVLAHNTKIDKGKVEVCPNSIEVVDMRISSKEKRMMRDKYGIPQDKVVFVYGGNLGKPQAISYLIECLKSQLNNENIFFLIVGSGTEYSKLEDFFTQNNPLNMKLMKQLPKEDYDRMISACDIGMIFLDYRFTIPNFPSRLLAYMQAGLPVLACTDPNSDIGKIITENNFGWWCESNSSRNFIELIEVILHNDVSVYKQNSYSILLDKYTVKQSYSIILNHLKKDAYANIDD